MSILLCLLTSHCIKQKINSQDVDTTFADRVYTEHKVDEDLKKKGYHTGKKHDGTYDKNLRGKKDTDPGSKEVGGNNRLLGSKEME